MSTEEKIWSYLKAKGLTDAGAAGLMGNLYAESGLSPKNLQNNYENKLCMTDDEYTARVDSGSYANFTRDGAGYGLAQWTYHTRKTALLEYARACHHSIGDLKMQLDFLLNELTTSFPAVLRCLKTADSVWDASDTVLLKFERPADQSEATRAKRAGYSQKFFDKYVKKGDTSKMGFTNSPLVSYTRISPNRTPNRNHVIDTISIHCVVGQCSVETLGNIFASPSKQASSNYGIGPDGRIGMYGEEKDRSWCTGGSMRVNGISGSSNDYQAVTTAVTYVSQTYVDALKKNGKFTPENQKVALDLAVDQAKKLLTAEAKDFLSAAYGSLNDYLVSRAEAEVRRQKMEYF